MDQKELLDYQQRVVDEKKELDIKIKGLQKFIENSEVFRNLSHYETSDLLQQLSSMRSYSLILSSRINRF